MVRETLANGCAAKVRHRTPLVRERCRTVKPVRRREVVRHYQHVFEVSERRACRTMGFWRASHRYQSRRDPAVELRMHLKELVESRVRYGYRRLHILLEREGWQMNHKRLYRLCCEEGLDPHPEPETAPCLPVSIRSIGGWWHERCLG